MRCSARCSCLFSTCSHCHRAMAEKDTSARLRKAVRGSFPCTHSPIMLRLIQKTTSSSSSASSSALTCETPILAQNDTHHWRGRWSKGTRTCLNSCSTQGMMMRNSAGYSQQYPSSESLSHQPFDRIQRIARFSFYSQI